MRRESVVKPALLVINGTLLAALGIVAPSVPFFLMMLWAIALMEAGLWLGTQAERRGRAN